VHQIVGYSLIKGIGDGEPIASERFTVGGHEWVSAPHGQRFGAGWLHNAQAARVARAPMLLVVLWLLPACSSAWCRRGGLRPQRGVAPRRLGRPHARTAAQGQPRCRQRPEQAYLQALVAFLQQQGLGKAAQRGWDSNVCGCIAAKPCCVHHANAGAAVVP
jgi:hypothetical protein